MKKSTIDRQLANEVLLRQIRDKAYPEHVLQGLFRKASYPGEIKARATSLVFGILREQGYVDFILKHFIHRNFKKLEHQVLVSLRLGTYELVINESHSHSSVDQAVSLLHPKQRKQRGLVNAVLRKVAQAQNKNELPSPSRDNLEPSEYRENRWSLPRWVQTKISPLLSDEELDRWAQFQLTIPKPVLRINTNKTTEETMMKHWEQAEIALKPHACIPNAFNLVSGGFIQELPGYHNGLWAIQDPAAQLVSLMAPLEEVKFALDMCAAPGGKTCHLAELLKPESKVLALDIHENKLGLIQKNVERLSLSNILVESVDSREYDEVSQRLKKHHFPSQVDLIVLDAPCSGLGTLRRNPDIKWKHPPQGLPTLQRELLSSAHHLLRPGGHLIYAVCTPALEETDEVVGHFLEEFKNYRIIKPQTTLLRPFVESSSRLNQQPVVRTWSHRDHCDSFFAVLLQKLP
ncbi:MAG: transcription antitermination factor NusB [Myxococcota bacterium]|nr:transcription antitermination factor NusB [Myxococcota bacterium]